MATVTARTLPWYAPPRVAHAWRRVKRYPVVSLSILTFVLVIPAGFAQYVANPAGITTTKVRIDSDTTGRSEEHTSELQSLPNLVSRPLLGKKIQDHDYRRQ